MMRFFDPGLHVNVETKKPFTEKCIQELDQYLIAVKEYLEKTLSKLKQWLDDAIDKRQDEIKERLRKVLKIFLEVRI